MQGAFRAPAVGHRRPLQVAIQRSTAPPVAIRASAAVLRQAGHREHKRLQEEPRSLVEARVLVEHPLSREAKLQGVQPRFKVAPAVLDQRAAFLQRVAFHQPVVSRPQVPPAVRRLRLAGLPRPQAGARLQEALPRQRVELQRAARVQQVESRQLEEPRPRAVR